MVRGVDMRLCFGWLHGVFMMAVLAGTVAEAQTFRGLIEPVQDVELSVPIPGRLAEVHYREGERVAKDEVILELDGRLEQLEVERRRLIYEDRAELDAALARRDLLAEDLAALRSLFERTGSVSREELRRKELEHTLAGLDIGRLEQAQAREQVEYRMAQEQRRLRILEAPFDGVVADVYFDAGESVQANQPIVRFVADDQCYLVLNIPAEVAAGLVLDEAVTIEADTQPPVVKSATIRFISPVVDPASGLRRVKLAFDNQAPRIEPGVAGRWTKE
jgi:RND family efflux transporter MFP subunit